MKYTFVMEQPDGGRLTFEGRQEHIHAVLDDFELFLRGSGYVFDGHLEIVDEFSETANEPKTWPTDMYNGLDPYTSCPADNMAPSWVDDVIVTAQPELFDDVGAWLDGAVDDTQDGLDGLADELLAMHDQDNEPEVQHGTA